jgi:hypothetical protein
MKMKNNYHCGPLGLGQCNLIDRFQNFGGTYFHHLEARKPEVLDVRSIRNDAIYCTSLLHYTDSNTDDSNLHLTTVHVTLTFADLCKPWDILYIAQQL